MCKFEGRWITNPGFGEKSGICHGQGRIEGAIPVKTGRKTEGKITLNGFSPDFRIF
jgi:hypothetical protein